MIEKLVSPQPLDNDVAVGQDYLDECVAELRKAQEK